MKKGNVTVTVDANMNKLKLRLRAIAKHAEALANELDAIENACECGSIDYTTIYQDDKPYIKVCDKCGERYFVDEDEVDEKNNQTTNQSDKRTI